MAAAGRPPVPRLYLVTDRRRTGGRPLVEVVKAALDGGVDAVQLREKDLEGRELFALAEELRRVTAAYGARLLVNDRIDVALAVGADGAHLGRDSFPPAVARELLGDRKLVAVSAHRPEEVAAAAADGADFAVFGPVYATPSKAGMGRPQGTERLAAAVRAAPIPVLAIGGINAVRVGELLAAGAAGVAVIRAILTAADPAAAARELQAAR